MPVDGIQSANTGAWPIQGPPVARPVDSSTSILRFGEVIRGLVLRFTEQETVIDLKGSAYTLKGNIGLQEGAEVLVRVAGLTPEPLLEVVPQPGQDLEAALVSLIRTNLADAVPTGELLANLQQALAALAADNSPQAALPSLARLQAFLQNVLASPNAPTADRVAQLVEDGGLHYEAKLANLALTGTQEPQALARQDWKGLLLQVQQEWTRQTQAAPRSAPDLAPGQAPHPQQPPAAGANLGSLIDHQLHQLEHQQALNVLAQQHGSAFVLEIPLVIQQSLTTAHLAIEPEIRGDSEEPGDRQSRHNLLFQMDLENFGQTKIEAWVSGGAMRVNFFAEHQQAVDQLRAELPVLRQTLQALGFHEVLLAADPLSRLPQEKRQKFDEVRAGVPADIHLLDVQV